MLNSKKISVFLLTFLIFTYIGYSIFRGTSADMTEVITYEMFGAKGDGVTNDYAAIKAAHDYANKKYIEDGILNTVYSCSETNCSNKKYYLGSSNGAGEIKIITNVDWRNANFIVDDYIDSNSDGINDVTTTDNLFAVVSPLRIYANSKSAYIPFLNYNDEVLSYLSSNKMIKPNTSNLKYLIDAFYNGKIKTSDFYNNNKEEVEKYFKSSQRWAVIITDSTKQYIRKGNNQNSGNNQMDIILLDGLTGDVLTDINWEFDDITEIKLYPISDNQITVGNGNFTTYTNNVVYTKDSSGNAQRSSYTNRNITLFYSGNVKLHNINHYINEEKHPYSNTYQDIPNGNMYYGFIRLLNSSHVEVVNSKLSAHTPTKLVSNNKLLSYTLNGTYDLIVDNSSNIFIDNIAYACNTYNSSGEIDYNYCYKKNVIDESKWGIMASNTSKNLFIVNSKMNRIDAHRGVTNMYVADSTIGVANGLIPMRLIGNGYFYGKNLKIDSGNHLMSLREDYGSTWNGTMVLDDINYIVNKNSTNPSIIYSDNEQNWDFGYNTYFPNIYINNLNIDTTTKNANNVDYVTFLNLSKLYKNGNTIDKSNSRNLYNFKGNIYLNNLTTNGNEVRLFNKDFINSNTDTLNINNYGGNNTVNLYLDNDVIVDSKVTSHSNPKFKLVNNMDNKISEVSTFFTNLEKKSKMPSPRKPLISKINLSNGKINEEINSNKFNYTANVDVDSITIELETAYVGTYTSWKNKTVNLNKGDNIIQFSVTNPKGNTTNYTLNIIKKSNDVVKSDIKTLDNITLNNGKLNETFNKDKNNYTANINSSTVNITVVKTDDKSTVTGDIGQVNLHYGTNILNITVTAENGNTNKYIIEIYRKYSFTSDKYTYKEKENYIYIGNENIDNNILKNITIPSELNKNINNENLVISYESEELLKIKIFNFIINKYNINNKNIKIDNTVTYNEFINNLKYSKELTYNLYNGNNKVTNGNIINGMDLKIYYNNNLIDNYKIEIENNNDDNNNENNDDDNNNKYEIIFDNGLNILQNDKIINYIKNNTTVKKIMSLVKVIGGDLFIKNNNNRKKENSELMATGDKLTISVDDIIKEEYIISILGDSNGDGYFNQLDLTDIRKHIVGWIDPQTNNISKKTGVYFYALDLNKDGVVNQLDLTKMRKMLVGLE